MSSIYFVFVAQNIVYAEKKYKIQKKTIYKDEKLKTGPSSPIHPPFT